MSIFPGFEQAGSAQTAEGALGEYKDIKWDTQNGCAVYRDGEPVIVSGLEAVLMWAYRALRTVRLRFPGQASEYGCEIEQLTGLPYTGELKQSEAVRYIKDVLLLNPYIKNVSVKDICFEQSKIIISAGLTTEYGEGDIYTAF